LIFHSRAIRDIHASFISLGKKQKSNNASGIEGTHLILLYELRSEETELFSGAYNQCLTQCQTMEMTNVISGFKRD